MLGRSCFWYHAVCGRPGFLTNSVGNSPDSLPGSGDFRFQQEIGPGQFNAVNGPVWITEFSFRAVPETGAVDVTFSNVDLYLSTSPTAPNPGVGLPLMSSTFANNVGPDNTLVYSGAFALSSPGCVSGSTPCPFDMVLTFTHPSCTIAH